MVLRRRAAPRVKQQRQLDMRRSSSMSFTASGEKTYEPAIGNWATLPRPGVAVVARRHEVVPVQRQPPVPRMPGTPLTSFFGRQCSACCGAWASVLPSQYAHLR